MILVSVIMISGLAVLYKKPEPKRLKLLLSFSGAYLLSISFLHLIPDTYNILSAHTAGIFILAGFLFQVLIEFFSEGIEHGHAHVHDHEHSHKYPYGMMAGLCLHSFLEGAPLIAEIPGELTDHNHSLITGIILHKIPISVTLMGTFIHYGMSKLKSAIWLFFFALMAPLGALFNQYIINDSNNDLIFGCSLAVVVGIFLHISTTILFESNENHRFNLFKLISILAGVIIAYFSI